MTDIIAQLTPDHRSYLNRSFSLMSIPEKNVSTCFVPKKEYETLSAEEKEFVQQTIVACVGAEEMTIAQFGEGTLDWCIAPTTEQADLAASQLADYMIYETQKEVLLQMALHQFQIEQKQTQGGDFVCFVPHKIAQPVKMSIAHLSAIQQATKERAIIVQAFNLTPDEVGHYWAVADPITGGRIFKDLVEAAQKTDMKPTHLLTPNRRFSDVPACKLHRSGNGIS